MGGRHGSCVVSNTDDVLEIEMSDACGERWSV